jgi:hypothetical protein
VNPKDTSVIAPTGSPALTLVTCYPFYYVGSAPQRFIVRALPVGAATTAVTARRRRPSPFGGPVLTVPRPTLAVAKTYVPEPHTPVVAPRDEPVSTSEAPAQPRKGPIQRAFRKIAGVFSPQRAKLP